MNQINYVRWADIIAECDNYRDGYVAVFRKYEGQSTDERDASNRIVKVTMTSFAERVRVPRQTFNDWVKVVTAASATSAVTMVGRVRLKRT